MREHLDKLQKQHSFRDWKPIAETLLNELVTSQDATAVRKRNPEPTSLWNWLWKSHDQHSRKKTIFIGQFDSTLRARANEALCHAVFHAGRRNLPNPEFHFISINSPTWGDIGNAKDMGTICIVGRPSLFRVTPWDLSKWSGRFQLPAPDPLSNRPQRLTTKSIQTYHRVEFARCNGLALGQYFVAAEENEQRTDYAIIQRFVLPDAPPILVLAGTTSLGTIGAVKWVMEDLESAIPAPPALSESNESEMEILLKVRGEIHNPPQSWRIVDRPHVVKAYFGQLKFDLKSSKWDAGPEIVCLENVKGKPVSRIYFDGTEHEISGETREWMIAIARIKQKSFLLSELIGNVGLWDDPHFRNEVEKKVNEVGSSRPQATFLADGLQRNHLHKSIEIVKVEKDFQLTKRFETNVADSTAKIR